MTGLLRRPPARFAVIGALTVAVAIVAAGPAPAADAAPPPGPTVTIDNFTFDPPVLTVAPGTTVTFVNRDDIPHLVMASDGSFRSPALDTDDRFTVTFAHGGTVGYFCSLHPHMTGRVIVRGGAG